jgi:hypothetical protein
MSRSGSFCQLFRRQRAARPTPGAHEPLASEKSGRYSFLVIEPKSPTTIPKVLLRQKLHDIATAFSIRKHGCSHRASLECADCSGRSEPGRDRHLGRCYRQLLSDLIDKPLLAPKGIEVLKDVTEADPRKTKLLAERESWRGSMDVACLSDSDAYFVASTNALETVDAAKVSRLGKVFAELRTETAIPHIYSAQVILYNVDQVKAPPRN